MGSLCSCFHVPEVDEVVVEENVDSNHGNGNCICPICFTHNLKTKYGALFGRAEVHAAPSNGQQTEAPSSSKRFPDEVLQAEEVHVNSRPEEEDECPICLEEFMPSNPKKTTECHHSYHLQCMFEWQARSEKCPVCAKVMVWD